MDLALTLLQTGKGFDERSGLAGISGSSRYFLCRLLCDEAPAASNTVASYVKRYGVTDRVVSLAIKELVECKAVDKTATQKENGAPGWTLRVASDFRDLLEVAANSEPVGPMAKLSLHVLTHDDGEARKKGKKRLSPYNRLVLAALLLKADEAGAVYGVGASDLKRIAGLSSDRLVSQLSKLQNLGYLRMRMGGLTGRHLFGRSTGAYFLNVGHPDFGGIAGHSYVLVRRDSWFESHTRHQAGMALYLAARTIQQRAKSEKSGRGRPAFLSGRSAEDLEREMASMWKADPMSRNAKRLHEFLRDEPFVQFAAYLQMLICRYASLIINTCLREGCCDSQSRQGPLQTQMVSDLGLGSEPEGDLEPVVNAVRKASIQQAVKAWEALCHDEVPRGLAARSGLSCAILPSTDINGSGLDMSILLYAPWVPENSRGRCSLLSTEFYGPSARPSVGFGPALDQGDERHLSDEMAFERGLRSPGKRYPKG